MTHDHYKSEKAFVRALKHQPLKQLQEVAEFGAAFLGAFDGYLYAITYPGDKTYRSLDGTRWDELKI